MRIFLAIALVCSALWDAQGFPGYYPYYRTNMDSLSYGASDSSSGAMVLNRYYQPYFPRAVGSGMAAFMVQQPSVQPSQGYYLADKRQPTQPDNYAPPQQNEVFYQPPVQESVTKLPEQVTKQTELADPTTERTEIYSTTFKATEPEITEQEIEEVEEQKPRKRVSKKKQIKRPIDEDEEEYVPRMPSGTFFPMFFGWGGRSGQAGGGEPGVMAIANAYSTGRGGVSSSHATAYGAPRTDEPTKL